jgi:tRNA (guanine-N7-)-methyltransferase
LPLPTERERHVLAQGLPVWRLLFSRNDAPVPSRSALERLAAALEPELEAGLDPAEAVAVMAVKAPAP